MNNELKSLIEQGLLGIKYNAGANLQVSGTYSVQNNSASEIATEQISRQVVLDGEAKHHSSVGSDTADLENFKLDRPQNDVSDILPSVNEEFLVQTKGSMSILDDELTYLTIPTHLDGTINSINFDP